MSEKFELESDCMQEKATDCVPLIKVACLEQRSLKIITKIIFQKQYSAFFLQNNIIQHLQIIVEARWDHLKIILSNHFLLTQCERRTGEYWPGVLAVWTKCSKARAERSKANFP